MDNPLKAVGMGRGARVAGGCIVMSAVLTCVAAAGSPAAGEW